MYSRTQVYEETIKYFNGDSLAANVWIDKYCLKKDESYMELTPDDTHKRLASEFARIEQKYPNPLSYEEIYSLLREFKYIIPGGSILYGCGNIYSFSTLGNCFVIGNRSDSYGGICHTDQEQVQLMKRRAGVGHDISHIRPEKALVSNAAGSSTGIIPFMHRYSNSTREVAQDGRRGALMLTIDIRHPESGKFILAKDNLSDITGANISVKVTDEFMDNPNKDIWDKIVHQAWKSAEPGVLFWDTIRRESIPACYGLEWEETSTNPCGEIPLCPYDSCRLMSVNLFSFVENPFTNEATFNYEKFKDVTYKAQRLMDDVVDLEEEKINRILDKIQNDPEPDEIKEIERNLWIKIKQRLLEGRRTGLSAVGLADTFAACNVIYGSDSSISLAEEIYKQFAISAYKSSIDMGADRGCFPIWDFYKECLNPFLFRVHKELNLAAVRIGRRNIALLTIPPSGSISLLAGISSGIEPVFQLWYKRRVKVTDDSHYDFVDQNGDKWKEYIIYHPKFKEWFLTRDNSDLLTGVPPIYGTEVLVNAIEEAALDYIMFNNSKALVQISPYFKSTAYEIDPIQRVKLQATIQKWIDHSISSTINLPENTTEETVSNIYLEAWSQGCKGITIYRENCRTGVLVNAHEPFEQHDAPKRPNPLPANIYISKSKGKEWMVVVGLYDGLPYEVFAVEKKWDIKHNFSIGHISKKRKGVYNLEIAGDIIIENFLEDISDEENNLTRMISTALRHGADIKFIVEQLNKSRGDITSFTKVIARILKKYIREGETTNDVCPQCGSELIYTNGCKECSRTNDENCTYSKC